MTAVVHYFAYGSNMHPLRMRERVPSSQVLTTGELPGFDLRFHKRSVDGSAKCNALGTGRASDKIMGVIYEIRADEKPRLDHAEFLGTGYNQADITVVSGTRELDVFTYIADPRYIDDSLKPYQWYRDLVAAGARHHQLSARYVTKIASAAAVEDPDPERAQRYFEILRSL